MGTYSSGEDLVIKTRKPYTITKQRERWTDEEHNRFLEALKLHGRAWQRIEEHIGTKTAVQIRSHAQKFFSKLEKEAFVKGVPIGQSLNIEIPPPRPKRRPSNPYPRKMGVGAPTSLVGGEDGKLLTPVSSLDCAKHILDLEKEPLLDPERVGAIEKLENANLVEENCTEVSTLSHEASCTSTSSASKTSILTTYREFVPSVKEVIDRDEKNESFITTEPKGNQKLDKLSVKKTLLDISLYSHDQLVHGGGTTDGLGQLNNFCVLPRHIPVHVLDGSLDKCIRTPSPESLFRPPFREKGGVHGVPNHNLFMSPIASAITENHNNESRTSSHQSFSSSCPSFMSINNSLDDYPSFLHNSSTFLDLIVSTLLQNPAAHTAACFAAAIWPGTNMEGCADVPTCTMGLGGGIPSRQLNPPIPNHVAIAAATVAAATSWWTTNGWLPLCVPLPASFTCSPTLATTAVAAATKTQSTEDGKASTMNKEVRNNIEEDPPLLQEDQQLDPEEFSEALQEQHSASNLQNMSSSDSEESGGLNLNTGILTADHEKKVVEATDLHDLNKIKGAQKKLDRSSCGSNTPSSSEVESDALENHEKGGKEEMKEADVSHLSSDFSTHRSRSNIGNLNDSWKEVSEEGRLAFQALFSREVLPQSFPCPHDLKNKQQPQYQKCDVEESTSACKKHEDATRLYLSSSSSSHSNINYSNGNIWANFSSGLDKNAFLRGNNKNGGGEHSLLTVGVGLATAAGHGNGNGKLKARRAGFKPYKRCSIEAKESSRMILTSSTSSQGDENVPKRIRLEGEALT